MNKNVGYCIHNAATRRRMASTLAAVMTVMITNATIMAGSTLAPVTPKTVRVSLY